VSIREIEEALRAFVQRACLDSDSPLKGHRTFEYFDVSVPMPPQLARQIGSLGRSWRLAVLDGTWQQHEETFRALPEYAVLVQRLKEATELSDIVPGYLEEHGLQMLRKCIDGWLNSRRTSLSTDGSVAVLQDPVFDAAILELCEEVCGHLAQSWEQQRRCVVYAPLEGLTVVQDLPLSIGIGVDVVPDGMLPLSVLRCERRARRSYGLRGAGALYLRYALPSHVEGRNHSGVPRSATAAVQAFLTALRFERRGWLAAPYCIVESNLPWLEARERVIDQNLPLGLLYILDAQVDLARIVRIFDVLYAAVTQSRRGSQRG
jgi:hypothetical protein